MGYVLFTGTHRQGTFKNGRVGYTLTSFRTAVTFREKGAGEGRKGKGTELQQSLHFFFL